MLIKTKYQDSILKRHYSNVGNGYFIWGFKKVYVKSYLIKDIKNNKLFTCDKYCNFLKYCIRDDNFFKACSQLKKRNIFVENGIVGENSWKSPILPYKIESL